MSRYGWGVDGYGRAFIDKDSNCRILLCMLPGYSGKVGVDILEEQDEREEQCELISSTSKGSVCE